MHHHNKLPSYCTETCETKWNVKNLLFHQSCFSEVYPLCSKGVLLTRVFFYLSVFCPNWSFLNEVRLCFPSPVCVSSRNPPFLLNTLLKPSFEKSCFLPSSQPLYSTQALWNCPLKNVFFCHCLCSRLLIRPSDSPEFVTFEALCCSFEVLSADMGAHFLPPPFSSKNIFFLF